MHILMMLAAGIALLRTLCALGQWRDGEIGRVRGARAFVPLWFIAVLVDLVVGAARTADGSRAVGLPALAICFVVPAAVAWRVGRRPAAERRRGG